MQNLLKFTLLTLISLTTLNAINLNSISDQTFSSNRYSGFINPAFNASSVQAKFINSKYLRIGNDIYSLSSPFEIVFNTSIKKDIGFFLNTPSNDLYYHNSNFETIKIPCQFSGDSILACARSYASITNGSVKEVEFSYYQKFNISKVTECQADENFNTETKECQKCPEGYSWDSENNRCYKDCSDVNKNMWGWTDGTCTDCSKETTHADIRRCYCKYFGLDIKPFSVKTKDSKTGLYIGFCSDDSEFWYKDPADPEIPKPDNNNTTPSNPDGPGNQNPNNPGGSGGDNGGGSGGNQGGGSGGNGGNSGGGSGGNQGGDNSGGSGGNNNGNNQGNGNSGGGSGGSGSGNGNGKDPKFNPGDFDFKDLQNDVNDFKLQYINGLNTMMGGFDNLKDGINQFIANVQGKGMNGITKKNVPTTCPRKHVIDFNGYPSELNFDFCKVVSPASGAFYHLFYVIFFLGFLMLIVKLLILSF